MTDNEIIKAMQCVIGNDVNCSECTYQKVLPFPSCRMMCAKNALDLINRQKAEKERLEDENYTLKNKIEIRDNLIEQLGSDIDIKYNTIYTMREKLKNLKSEAIKEFAERLKEHSFVDKLSLDGKETVYVDDIDNLVKEMTEVETNQRKEDEGK